MQGLRRKPPRLLLELLRRFQQKLLREQWDIVAPLPQRRQMHLDDIQSVEEIFAEFPLLDHLREVSIGCANQANVDAYGLVASQSLKISFLNHAQQLGLQSQSEVADFIQKQGSSIGSFNPAASRHQRA